MHERGRHTPHDSIGCAYASHCAAKMFSLFAVVVSLEHGVLTALKESPARYPFSVNFGHNTIFCGINIMHFTLL